MELDKQQEKLRQREGWFHWVVASQGKASGDFSVESPLSPYSPSGGVGLGLVHENVGPPSIVPSEASDIGMVRKRERLEKEMVQGGGRSRGVCLVVSFLSPQNRQRKVENMYASFISVL